MPSYGTFYIDKAGSFREMEEWYHNNFEDTFRLSYRYFSDGTSISITFRNEDERLLFTLRFSEYHVS